MREGRTLREQSKVCRARTQDVAANVKSSDNNITLPSSNLILAEIEANVEVTANLSRPVPLRLLVPYCIGDSIAIDILIQRHSNGATSYGYCGWWARALPCWPMTPFWLNPQSLQ